MLHEKVAMNVNDLEASLTVFLYILPLWYSCHRTVGKITGFLLGHGEQEYASLRFLPVMI